MNNFLDASSYIFNLHLYFINNNFSEMQKKKKNKFKTKSLRIPLYLSSFLTSTYKFYIAQKNHDKKIPKSP